jgi:hypothetical protein
VARRIENSVFQMSMRNQDQSFAQADANGRAWVTSTDHFTDGARVDASVRARAARSKRMAERTIINTTMPAPTRLTALKYSRPASNVA